MNYKECLIKTIESLEDEKAIRNLYFLLSEYINTKRKMQPQKETTFNESPQ